MEDKEYYRIKEYAEIMNISPGTVKNYIRKGKIQAEQKFKGGAVRIHYTEIPSKRRGF